MAIALHRTDTRGGRGAPVVQPDDNEVEGSPVVEPDGKRESLRKRTLSGLFTIAIIAAVVYLWPATLGGATRLVIVSGTSMEPTYDLGDIVVTRDGADPSIGDAIVFEVPDGTAAGQLVIHRIVRVNDEGEFITQGDNRDTADQWALTEDDIVGEPLLHIPKGGKVVRFLQQVWVLAIVIGLLVIFLLWPDDEDDEPTDAVTVGVPRVDDDPDDDPDDGPAGFEDIDDATMREAEAWLDEQLATLHDAEAWLDEQLATILERTGTASSTTR